MFRMNPGEKKILRRTRKPMREGKSTPRAKSNKTLKVDTVLAERINMVYLGTEVVRGNCKALVVETGMKTEFGKIAELVQKVEPERNPLIERINQFAKKLGYIVNKNT